MLGIVLGVLALGLVIWIVRVAGWRYALKRVAQAALVLLLVTFLTSVLMRQFPADPCLVALGTAATPESVAQCRLDQGLDQSVFEQYGTWAGGILTGDLGLSRFLPERNLSDDLATRMPRTLFLFTYSQLFALTIAIPMGIWAAYNSSRPSSGRLPKPTVWIAIAAFLGLGIAVGWALPIAVAVAVLVPAYVYNALNGGASLDRLINIQSFALLSLPVFVIGETLRYLFAIRWSIYDLKGYVPMTTSVSGHIKSIWLPSLVLGLAVLPVYLRLLRADMVQNLQQDFVAVAKAKGLPNWWVLIRHVLRPSSLTLLTVAGVNIAQLVNGAVVVEFIFDLDGMGSWLVESVQRSQFFAVQTVVALVAVVFIVVNMIVDLIYTSVDPRVKAEA